MATLTVYSGAGTGGTTSDARVYRQGVTESYDTIKVGAGNAVTATATTDASAQILCSATSNKFDTLSRGVFSFDTSSIGFGVSVTSATLSIFGSSKADSLDLGVSQPWRYPNYVITGVVMGNAGTPAMSDFQAVLGINFNATALSYNALSVTAYNDIPLNEFGMTSIKMNGISQFATRWDWDLYNFGGIWTAGSGQVYIITYFADNAGTTNDPKLVINYSNLNK